ncbi:MAG: RecQ family ATP-dependent DNA helicase, partial [Alistipes sp.]|nr:RecQ family ATP-dependent DNA helicase [Alistipes sp.]
AESRIFRGDFSRPNLSYAVRHVEDKRGQLLRLCQNVAGAGIVYVRTREATEEIASWLREEGITAAAYHGGLPHTERSLRQEEWMSGEARVMVATNAFGMGIDKPDVRFVVHYTLCDSLESYYQEAGRAGRDGKRSYALLMVEPGDSERVHRRFMQEFPPLERIKEIYEKVGSFLQVAIGDGALHSYTFNINDFCSRERLYPGMVRSALDLLEQNGYLTLTDEMENPARILFTVSRDDLYRIRCEREELDPFIRTILRLYNGVFTDFRRIDELEIAHWSGYTVERVKELLKRLWQLRIIRYIPSNRSPLIFYPTERLPREDLYIAPETYTHRKELAQQRFEQMLHYAEAEGSCRSVLLERYFGSPAPQPCGVCDYCLEKRREAKGQEPSEEAVLALLEEGPLSIQEVVTRLRCNADSGCRLLTRLLEEEKIRQQKDGKVIKN